MALTPPAFKKDAVPSPRGWHDPRTFELLVAKKLKQEDIDEYNGVGKVEAAAPAPVETYVLPLEKMSRDELIKLADEHGVDYLPRTRNATLISRLQEVM